MNCAEKLLELTIFFNLYTKSEHKQCKATNSLFSSETIAKLERNTKYCKTKQGPKAKRLHTIGVATMNQHRQNKVRAKLFTTKSVK